MGLIDRIRNRGKAVDRLNHWVEVPNELPEVTEELDLRTGEHRLLITAATHERRSPSRAMRSTGPSGLID
jgi:hypothetical protein